MVKSLFILFFITFTAYAQQEKAESNNDLRFGKKIFIFKDQNETAEYIFSKKSNGESYLSSKNKGVTKLSNIEESEFEPVIVNLFIKIKYQLSEYKKKCKKKSYLDYLGDEYYVCADDDSRIRLVAEIKKRFENLIDKAKR